MYNFELFSQSVPIGTVSVQMTDSDMAWLSAMFGHAHQCQTQMLLNPTDYFCRWPRLYCDNAVSMYYHASVCQLNSSCRLNPFCVTFKTFMEHFQGENAHPSHRCSFCSVVKGAMDDVIRYWSVSSSPRKRKAPEEEQDQGRDEVGDESLRISPLKFMRGDPWLGEGQHSDEENASFEMLQLTPSTIVVSSPEPQVNQQLGVTPQQISNAFLPIIDFILNNYREPLPGRFFNNLTSRPILTPAAHLREVRAQLFRNGFSDPWEVIHSVIISLQQWIKDKPTKGKKTKSQNYAEKVLEKFAKSTDGPMKELGYCCGQRRVFKAQILYCQFTALCRIPVGMNYFVYQNQEGAVFTACQKCFRMTREENVKFGEAPHIQNIPKAEFQKKVNNEVTEEPFVTCTVCGRKFHQICALHINEGDENDFVCDGCRSFHQMEKNRPFEKVSAEKIPATAMTSFIEDKVNALLQAEAEKQEKNFGRIFIRLMGNISAETKVSKEVKRHFGYDIASNLPYRSKAIFVFQRRPIDDAGDGDEVEICFFAFYVQEYFSNSESPSRHRLYLSYLDSVQMFEPRSLRTIVYQEILLGYMEYMKGRGFAAINLWPCPAVYKNDDFIFRIHPKEQRKPDKNRLCAWYESLFEQGKQRQIFVDYHYMSDKRLKSVLDLPYYKGDLWPDILERTIVEEKQLEKSETLDDRILNRMRREILNKNNKYFVAYFFNPKDKEKLQENQQLNIKDGETGLKNSVCSSREKFMDMERDKNLEFSDLRRVLFSTKSILHDFMKQQKEKQKKK